MVAILPFLPVNQMPERVELQIFPIGQMTGRPFSDPDRSDQPKPRKAYYPGSRWCTVGFFRYDCTVPGSLQSFCVKYRVWFWHSPWHSPQRAALHNFDATALPGFVRLIHPLLRILHWDWCRYDLVIEARARCNDE